MPDMEWVAGDRDAEAVEKRWIGQVQGSAPGPTLVAVGALHGNELAGVKAAKRVLASLEERAVELRGRFIALVGNVAAMERGTRFVQMDLNRLWRTEVVEALMGSYPGTLVAPEELELKALALALDQIADAADGPVALLDLHTSSATSPPFIAVGDDPLADRIVEHTGVVEVKGTARYLKGMLVEHAGRRGWAAMAFEAGRHEDELSVSCHEAMMWQVMVELGIIAPEMVPEQVRTCEALRRRDSERSNIVEIVYRHAVTREDGFRMIPGFENFEPVTEGQPLGKDRNGIVASPLSGRLFLPLYQEQGDEGFFIVREVSA